MERCKSIDIRVTATWRVGHTPYGRVCRLTDLDAGLLYNSPHSCPSTMSRRTNPPLSSKYTISSPKPFTNDLNSNNAYDESYHPSTTASSSRTVPSQAVHQVNPTNPATTSPARPARSRMRDTPQPQPPPQAPGAPGRRRGQSSMDSTNGDGDTIPALSDPFAYDRTQRSQLRAQASAAPTPPFGNDSGRLRTAVGAFMAAGRTAEPIRPTKSRARQTKRDEKWQLDDGGRYGEIDSVLRKIQKSWPFVLESDFAPSTLALSLLSETDGHSRSPLRAFLQVHDELSDALQSAVQAHFQSFAASLPAHSSFNSTLGRAQQQTKTSKTALREARAAFAGKGKGELAGVKSREKSVRDMLSLLDTM